MEKSELILVGMVDSVKELVSLVHCRVGRLPSTYLGLPLVPPLNSQQFGVWWGKEFTKGLLYERGDISQQVGG